MRQAISGTSAATYKLMEQPHRNRLNNCPMQSEVPGAGLRSIGRRCPAGMAIEPEQQRRFLTGTCPTASSCSP